MKRNYFGWNLAFGLPCVLLGMALMLQCFLGEAQAAKQEKDTALLFTSFRKNGEDGLHLLYSLDGYKWSTLRNDQTFLRPTVGGKLMRDPQITQGPDGTYHMVWTTAWTQYGVGYASSKDLINWSEQKLFDVMAHEPATKNVWAPELFYDASKKEYLIFWASTIPGRFPETEKAGDDKYNHRIYYTSTRDFSTFSPTKLFFEPGFNVIDTTLVKDGSKYLLFLKNETRNPAQKNIRLAIGKKATGPFGPVSEPITGKYWAEGPTAIKVGKTWFVYFDRYMEHRYGVVTSTDLKIWSEESDKVEFPKDHRHGSVMRVPLSLLNQLKQQ